VPYRLKPQGPSLTSIMTGHRLCLLGLFVVLSLFHDYSLGQGSRMKSAIDPVSEADRDRPC
jgi:hypothetical protein